MTDGSVTNPMMRASPPQRGQNSMSTAYTLRNSSAQRRPRARNAGQTSAPSAARDGAPGVRASRTTGSCAACSASRASAASICWWMLSITASNGAISALKVLL